MDPFGDPWLQSPNGSGAQDAWPPEESLQHDTFAMGAEAPGPTVVQDEDDEARVPGDQPRDERGGESPGRLCRDGLRRH